MPSREPRHLRAVGTRRLATPRGCRTIGCALQRQGTLGFCAPCEAVYHAAVQLRERLLAYRGAQLQAARPALFDGMDAQLRGRLVAHIAAQARTAAATRARLNSPAWRTSSPNCANSAWST